MANAVVILSTIGSDPEDAVARTDSSGAFGFAYLPPAKYLLQADHDRYERVWYGAEDGARRTPLVFHAGETRTGVALRLKPLGAISGTVTDAAGHPIEHAQIALLQRGYARGKPAWHNVHWAETDVQGRYRIFPVFPGKYVIQASARHQQARVSRSEASYGAVATSLMYGAQLYPRGALDNVSPLKFVGGERLDGVDFQLPAETAVDVKVKFNVPEGGPESVIVQMIGTDGSQQISFGAPVNAPDFHTQLPPGQYRAVAMAQSPSKIWRTSQEVDVTPATAELVFDLSPGIDLAGRVDFEVDAKQKPRFRVHLTPGDGLLTTSAPAAQTDPDGKFVLHGVPPGIWDIGVSPLPSGGYIKSMLLGDYDVLTNEMVITSGAAAPLNIVVSARGGAVTGTVAEDAVSHSRQAVVLLAPDGKYARVFSFYRVASADEEGNFQFKSITPGRYKLYAFGRIEPGAWQEPDFLNPYREQAGEPFTIAEDQTVTREGLVLQHLKEDAK